MSELLKAKIVRYDPKKHANIFFTCGKPNIDSYLYEYCVVPDPEAVMYLWISENSQVLGFFSLSCYAYNLKEVNPYSKVEKDFIIPAVQIKAFAISSFYQKEVFPKTDHHYSDELLYRALALITIISLKYAGAEYVYLSALNTDDVVSFYKRNGFMQLDSKNTIVSNECVENDLVPMILRIKKPAINS